ncbi:hypothetical protein [Inhella proteolytica]|uniref:DUF3828 domain-containing protein n=1 Tax=Inhella proteolytica TaxID=2795029 RepID=A0A931J2F7_9BURK|nr:hypothetical protein [Inhella proteolytica]MBH9577076.1 hypothetical protein [Inhella proteolytica]
MRAALTTALALLLLPAAALASSPQQTIEAFYRWRMASAMTGAPRGDELKQLRPWLGRELLCLLQAAGELRDRAAAAQPDEKPPFVEGDLFSSVFEGPQRLRLGAVTQRAGQAAVELRFEADTGAQPPVFRWSDRALLRREQGRWVVVDIEYRARVEFGNHGALRESLRAALEPADPALNWPGEAATRCAR